MALERGLETPTTSHGPSVETEELGRLLDQRRRRSERRSLVSAVAAPTVFLGAALVLWELVVRWLEVPPYLLPAPTAIAREAVDKYELLLRHSVITAKEVLIGYAIAVAVGTFLALSIASSKLAERIIYPLIVSAQATPKSALAPLFIIWFGFGLMPKIVMVFLIAFFPVVIGTVVGLTSLDQEKRYLARITGLGGWGTFTKIQLPHALPSIFGGLKIGITLAVIGAVVAEFVGADAGLGYLLIVSTSTLNTTQLFAALVSLNGLGVSLFLVISWVEDLAIPWHVSKRRRQ